MYNIYRNRQGMEWNGNIYISQTSLSLSLSLPLSPSTLFPAIPHSLPFQTLKLNPITSHHITSHHMTISPSIPLPSPISTQAAPSEPPNPSPRLARGTPPHSLPISRRNQTFSDRREGKNRRMRSSCRVTSRRLLTSPRPSFSVIYWAVGGCVVLCCVVL